MTDATKLDVLAERLDQVDAREALARSIRSIDWPGWSLRNVRARLRDWLDPDRQHHFPLVRYEAYLEQVGFDPLAECHAAAVERGRRRVAEMRELQLERELESLRAERPGVRAVRRDAVRRREVG